MSLFVARDVLDLHNAQGPAPDVGDLPQTAIY